MATSRSIAIPYFRGEVCHFVENTFHPPNRFNSAKHAGILWRRRLAGDFSLKDASQKTPVRRWSHNTPRGIIHYWEYSPNSESLGRSPEQQHFLSVSNRRDNIQLSSLWKRKSGFRLNRYRLECNFRPVQVIVVEVTFSMKARHG
jgi:hypothetical protein